LLLATSRLLIRRWTLDDAPAAFAMFSDPEVMKYVGDGRPVPSLEAMREGLGRRVERYESERLGSWAVVLRETEELVGGGALNVVEDGPEIEVAYQLGRRAWGKGYATEAARALLGHGFDALGLDRVIGITYPENLASRRVLEKIGMTYQGAGGYFGIPGAAVYAVERPGLDRGLAVTLERRVAAPADRVFAAWTTAEGLSGWFTRNAEVLAMVGGRYRNADGDTGRFLTLLPPRRVAFTWEHPEHAPGTTVEVDLEAVSPGETLVRLHHRGLAGPEAVADLTEGWTWALDSLRHWLATGRGLPSGGG
jgi:RimJ/RimL family protein N-acetyltransferase/uncharacterized protein YndB with AHSA1/START domain